MDQRTQVADITVRRREALELVFADGVEARFTVAELRQVCPCAHCRGAREAGRPPYRGDPAELEVTDAELVGAWGLRLVWQDGHGTGIYPWERLRDWADSGSFRLRPDSGFADHRAPAQGATSHDDAVPTSAHPATADDAEHAGTAGDAEDFVSFS